MTTERETRWGIQIQRDKIGSFEVWESVPVIKNGMIRRKVGDTLELDGATYEVTRVTESGAVAKAISKRKVEYTTDEGKQVSYMATANKEVHISAYRHKEEKTK